MKPNKLNISNISTAALILFVLLLVISPDAKAWVIRRFMDVGLFQPSLNLENEQLVLGGNPADIKFTDGANRTTTLADLKGKVVFINFWATWCPPCRAEMPSINKLANSLKGEKDIAFVLLDADGNFEKANQFMQQRKFELPVYIPASNYPESMFTGSLPTTVILNKKGQLVYKHEGAANFGNEKTLQYLKKLINE